MIARTWNGRVPARHAHDFEQHMVATGVAEAAEIPGYRGGQILRTETDDYVEFRLITYWDSWEPIWRFAGQNITTAVLYPGDEKYELIPATTVEHHYVTTSLPFLERPCER